MTSCRKIDEKSSINSLEWDLGPNPKNLYKSFCQAFSKKPRSSCVSLPNIAERRQVHLINPASCAGKYAAMASRLAEEQIRQHGGELVKTKGAGDAEQIAAELFTKDRFAHLVIYGGDGTVYEAVNGIMKSGHSSTASFSVIPFGSGNDFSAYANEKAGFGKAELVRLDVCEADDGERVRYFINMLNIGFDCSVVWRKGEYRNNPLLRGKAAYLAGVAAELIHKKALSAKIVIDGGDEMDIPLLLTACANGQFCGGGFCAAPLADMTDGLMDVLIVRDLSRRRFLSLVRDYRAGTYIDADGTMKEPFEEVLMYRRCARYCVSNIERYCIDGEVLPAKNGSVTVTCRKNSLWFAAL